MSATLASVAWAETDERCSSWFPFRLAASQAEVLVSPVWVDRVWVRLLVTVGSERVWDRVWVWVWDRVWVPVWVVWVRVWDRVWVLVSVPWVLLWVVVWVLLWVPAWALVLVPVSDASKDHRRLR